VQRAIGFKDKLAAEADKIRDVWADRDLTPTLQSFETPIPKQPPKTSLHDRRIAAQMPRETKSGRAGRHGLL
jgi:hypothetical protein